MNRTVTAAIVAFGVSLAFGQTVPSARLPIKPPLRPPPRLLAHTCQPLEYPLEARRHELEGVVRVRFDVSDAGKVVGILITRSSGHDSLDAATLAAVRTCEFAAATSTSGPIASSAFMDFAWRLEPAASPP